MIWGIVKSIVGAGAEVAKGWQLRKKAKLESELAINQAATEARVGRLRTKQEGDIAWETTSIKNAGWKDEWFTVVLSIPAVMCFVPGLAIYVDAGFRALQQTPDWYKWAFCLAVGSSFGYKKIADFMALRKGN